MYSNEPVRDFIRRCKLRLDEEVGQTTNFWSTSESVEYMREGVREVWQAVRETHQNWFVKQMNSTDGTVNIGGRNYDTYNLAIVSGREKLLLPPDFHELLFLESPPDVNASLQVSDPFFPRAVFEYRNLTQRRFREDALNHITTNVRRYLYDVVYGPGGPYILFSPPISLQQTLSTRIMYIALPTDLTIADTFEGTGFTTLMVDAVLAYTCYAAAKKQDLVENLQTLGQAWALKRELATRAAGPKQTRDEETVEGYLEDEDM